MVSKVPAISECILFTVVNLLPLICKYPGAGADTERHNVCVKVRHHDEILFISHLEIRRLCDQHKINYT